MSNQFDRDLQEVLETLSDKAQGSLVAWVSDELFQELGGRPWLSSIYYKGIKVFLDSDMGSRGYIFGLQLKQGRY